MTPTSCLIAALPIIIDLVFIALLTQVLSKHPSYQFYSICIRDMDGLVVCAMDWHSSSLGVRTLVPPPVQGRLAAPQPPPLSASRPTISAAGGWVACLVFIFFYYVCNTSKNQTPQHQHTCSSAPRHRHRRRTWDTSPPHIPLPGFKPRLQSGRRLHCHCTGRPKSNLTVGNFYGSNK